MHMDTRMPYVCGASFLDPKRRQHLLMCARALNRSCIGARNVATYSGM